MQQALDRCRPRAAVQRVPSVPLAPHSDYSLLNVFKEATTDGPTHLWGLSTAASPRPKSWVWMAPSDAAAAAGSGGSAVPRTEAARRLKAAPRRRGTEEEADQTREDDWEG